MKKNNEIKFACEDCGMPPEEDKEKSNENWKVVKTVCECSGRIKIQIGTKQIYG
jgi:hypothetical protein